MEALLMSPNNTTSRIPSSLSKSFAVIRSFSVLSRGLFTAAASQEMGWFSQDTALAWPGSLCLQMCSVAHGLPALLLGAAGRESHGAQLAAGVTSACRRLSTGFLLCWMVLEADSSCLLDSSENHSPGKRFSNLPHSCKAAAQGPTRGGSQCQLCCSLQGCPQLGGGHQGPSPVRNCFPMA